MKYIISDIYEISVMYMTMKSKNQTRLVALFSSIGVLLFYRKPI